MSTPKAWAIFATSEPMITGWRADLAHILRKEVQCVVSNPLDVSRFLMEFYGVTRSVRKAKDQKDSAHDLGNKIINFEQLLELGKGASLGADDQHIVQIVDWLLQYAFEQRASDIHVEPRRDLGIVRFRIDGVLHQVYQIPMTVLAAMTSRIKVLGRMDVIEKRRPQDGRIKTRMPDGQEVELRLATLPTAFGEKLVMRIFDPDVLVRDFSELGFAPEEMAIWREMSSQPNGIILVTGPTGSGKTTTLYSILNHINSDGVNIMTLEDPVEYPMTLIRQTSVAEAAKLDFANGVRALMRQDPDAILVGEVRDEETAEMAFRAAMTGHQVYTTLHTNSAVGAIPRLLDIGIVPDIMSGNIIGVIAQRLVRKLCRTCRQSYDPDVKERRLLGMSPTEPVALFRSVGCEQCDYQGYRGRVGIMEILKMDPAIDELVARRATAREILAAARAKGFKTLAEDGIRLVRSGVTSVDELMRVADLTDRMA